ncbi:NAD(P)H-dependent oxidoreductase [Marivita sp. XM-24bin2]|uniref:FMN-dependent NADH-azoreductase n=1 Tax=unclassified Marivita TaxID=2632480 RepID=UPI000D79779C|nr:NAD(P)H-dependent oxidoreductase [Marivita sp. XM-24bin2]MCR9108166.1 NAD(P)H-dependent oxidoreductase [Paracoccaceae bacterium]PWL37240.1 MAG: FMN-dependent NADH-azoreductase [Marivita sp. XM-24bin2]
MTNTILQIDTSARYDGSESRALTKRIVDRLAPATVIHRDLSTGMPAIDGPWLAANWMPEDQRTDEDRQMLALSDTLIEEIKSADTLVIGAPIYNFGIPATLKSWVDHVARAGITFKYSEAGPQGLMTGKRAIVAITSGGTQIGSDIDFASGYLRHVLGFIGITDVQFVAADQLAIDADASHAKATAALEAIAA